MPAIGIFDSGIGGLTVLRALKEALPDEAFVYLGDTARLPYGSKSPETIRRYLSQNIAFLERKKVKALVVACNSASTVLIEASWDGLPIYGVINPGARAAAAATREKRIGVLGTRATITSSAYARALKALDGEIEVVQQACPLLVPLVEEGWAEDSVTVDVLKRYLETPLAAGVDTLVLGCTHYPVLKQRIAELVGPDVALVDSAEAIAAMLKADLDSGRIPRAREARMEVYTTDSNPAFIEVGRRILAPYKVTDWQQADLK